MPRHYTTAVFPNTDAMLGHCTDTAKSMLNLFPSRVSPPQRMVLGVAPTPPDMPLPGMPRVPIVHSDVIEPIASFGLSMGLVSGWWVQAPGVYSHMSPPTTHGTTHGEGDGEGVVMPLGGLGYNDHTHTYLACFYLSRTMKGSHLDQGGLCRGDGHAFVVRARCHLLFGLAVHMGFVLQKDLVLPPIF